MASVCWSLHVAFPQSALGLNWVEVPTLAGSGALVNAIWLSHRFPAHFVSQDFQGCQIETSTCRIYSLVPRICHILI
jgi:hypothetical protein